MRRVGVGEGLPRHRREMELSSSFRPQPGAPWRGLRVLGARLRTVRRQTWPAFLKTADERKPCARRGAGPVPASGCGTEGGPCAGRGLAGLRSVVVQVADVGLICGHRGQVAGPHPAPSLGASTDGSVHGDHGIPGLSCLDRAAAHKTIGHVTVFLGCRVVRGQW